MRGGERRARRLATAVTLAVLAPVLVACGDNGSSSTSSSSSIDLNGRSFESTSVEGHRLVPGTSIVLSFDDDHLSASAGCNTMAGPVEWTDSQLTVTGQLASTMMGCPDDLSRQDQWLSRFLMSDPHLRLDGNTLELSKGDTVVVFEEQASLPIEGTSWVLDGLIANDAVSTVPIGVEAGLMIEGNRMTVRTGCNNGSGEVTVAEGETASEGVLSVGPLATTRMACGPDETMVEHQMLTVLDGKVDYRVDGDSLELTNGTNGLTFKGSAP